VCPAINEHPRALLEARLPLVPPWPVDRFATCRRIPMFSDFEARIVRQESCGVNFNAIIADRVGELWYDTPPHRRLSLQEALELPLAVDRMAAADWKEMGILRDHV